MLIHEEYDRYRILASYDPCDLFKFFEVEQMHGLNLKDCKAYNNTAEDAYIAGLCNYSPRDNKVFLFINLSRCTDDVKMTGLIMHEFMHLTYKLWIVMEEEEMISWAEEQTYKLIKTIKQKALPDGKA